MLLAMVELCVAQAPVKPTSADIFLSLQKLQVLGSALYVAAHPDDENTRMISYFANARHYHTTYLSLTRGDGGQNLIGTEIGDLLGLIRTQELLRARQADGGNQLFTRANDFGYSKHAEETLEIWNKDEVLSDVVLAIRKTRPDVIINRFDHRTSGRTHGHHTSSAILSHEAFDLAGKKSVYPEQLKHLQPWSPTRLFFNTSWFFYGSRENFAKADKSDMVSVDVGVYYPLRGKSNNEIAAESRSFHKSQGFGATGARGSEMEYLELIKGAEVTPEDDPFKGINTTWSRIEGGAPVATLLSEIEDDFDLTNPGASVPKLVEAYRLIQSIPNDGFWVPRKLTELQDLITNCTGLYIEAVADDFSAAPGQSVQLQLEAINRSAVPVDLTSVAVLPSGWDSTWVQPLADNQRYRKSIAYQIPVDASFSTPYWLKEAHSIGMYQVDDLNKRGLPESNRPVQLAYTLDVNGLTLSASTPIVYKRNDPVHGEVYRPFEISPPVFLNFTEDVMVFGTQSARTVQVVVKAGSDDVSGHVSLQAPTGWDISPQEIAVHLSEKGEESRLTFTIVPPESSSEAEMKAIFKDSGAEDRVYNYTATIIEYDHIPTQTILKQAQSKIVKVDLQKAGDHVGYIMGAGDKVPKYLRQIGYDVSLLEEDDLVSGDLSQYDAIIVGIRAYNTNDRLRFHQDRLFRYVEEGGTMIVQYNTNRRIKVDQIAPYPLKISRDRVTVEGAEVRFLAPNHPVLNSPNQITPQDFDGWVQERGLYFPNEWDDQFTAILSCNDPGEDPKDGGLLVAPHGKGWYIYTGYSWFRELPAGVPGAYRLFTNLISIGKRTQP